MNRDYKLLEQLKNPEYRRGFVEAHAKDTIAFQIRQLRKAEKWEQSDLARKAFGNPKLQPMISRYENPDYGKYSITTLLELANAFDVALAVRFVPFSELVEWDWASSSATLCPPKYAKDQRLETLAGRIQTSASAVGIGSPSTQQACIDQGPVVTGLGPIPSRTQGIEHGAAA